MSGFVAHLTCPLCTWASVASAPTYGEAEQQVTRELLEHLDARHPESARLPPPSDEVDGASDEEPKRSAVG